MSEFLSVATAPKTATFQMRINPEIKKNVEDIYAKVGMTMTDAFNIFIQQTLNVQGLPLLATTDTKSAIKEQAKALLMIELQKGLDSAAEEGWISEEEMWKEFGDEK